MPHVVGAALVDDLDAPTRLLAARRCRGALAGGWELPGGKVEPGEDPDAALRRELHEELALEVALGVVVAGPRDGGWPLGPAGTLRVRLALGPAPVQPGPDHDELRWLGLGPDDDPAAAVPWLEADVPVVAALHARLHARRLVVLGDREAGEEVLAALEDAGATVDLHRELLAGDDDLEDAQWVVALEPGPGSLPASEELLDDLAERHEGWVERE